MKNRAMYKAAVVMVMVLSLLMAASVAFAGTHKFQVVNESGKALTPAKGPTHRITISNDCVGSAGQSRRSNTSSFKPSSDLASGNGLFEHSYALGEGTSEEKMVNVHSEWTWKEGKGKNAQSGEIYCDFRSASSVCGAATPTFTCTIKDEHIVDGVPQTIKNH